MLTPSSLRSRLLPPLPPPPLPRPQSPSDSPSIAASFRAHSRLIRPHSRLIPRSFAPPSLRCTAPRRASPHLAQQALGIADLFLCFGARARIRPRIGHVRLFEVGPLPQPPLADDPFRSSSFPSREGRWRRGGEARRGGEEGRREGASARERAYEVAGSLGMHDQACIQRQARCDPLPCPPRAPSPETARTCCS